VKIMHEKSRSRLAIALGGLALLVAGGSVRADGGGFFCHCPPPLRWCSEQAPCIKFKCACPRPVCDPCDLQHYGVFATCWHPWPFQPNWSHCQSPPPGAVLPTPAYPPYAPRAPQERRADPVKEGEFPAPRSREPREMEAPQVRNTAYRVVEQPAAPVREVPPAPRRIVEQPTAPVREVPPAPRRIVEEAPVQVSVPQTLPTLGYQIIETPAIPVQKTPANVTVIRIGH
jgi:hypothetical protein